jgi:tetratricopeptide (TPR) repeat protein
MAGRAFVSRFSPNRTDPELLEAIFVQRHTLAEVWLERLRDSIHTGAKHHLLAVGPRGCGKSHLVALLVQRLRRDPAVRQRVRIAWLPEDETTPSFWKFLLRILRALNAEYGDEFPPPPRDQLAAATDERRTAVLIDYLLKKLAGRTLLVVVENLDDVMRGLKDEGQKRWRAFLQEHPVAATLATAQQLIEDVSERGRPFFHFFQIEHLRPLSADEALLLLQKIAEQNNNASLVAFLQTPTGRARVRAIRHLAGGSHRVFIILSEFATRENLDDLVTALEELLDELTPYYQERLRWLRADQQREIVEFLCRQARAVPVKEIAGELFLTDQTAAAQLKQLKDKGYVTGGARGRESRYELAEPLMRLCVEVKDPQREPIRLIVEFLRVWYDRAGMEARLQCLPADADRQRQHLQAALQAHRPGLPDPVEEALKPYLEAARTTDDQKEIVRVLVQLAAPGPVEEALNRDLEEARVTGDREVMVRVLVELAAIADSWWLCHAVADELVTLGRQAEALVAWDRAIELDPKIGFLWLNKGYLLMDLGRSAEAVVAYERVTELNPNDATTWNTKGYLLIDLGRFVEAMAAFDRAIKLDPKDPFKLDPNVPSAWNGKGIGLIELGMHAKAQAACDQAIQLEPRYFPAWNTRGRAKLRLGQIGGAMADFVQALELNRDYPAALESLAEVYVLQGNWAVAAQTLSNRFHLSISRFNSSKSRHLPDVIATIFHASNDRMVWAHRVGQLASIAREVYEDWEIEKAEEKVKPPPSSANSAEALAPPNPLAVLGDSLVRSLTKPAYAAAAADALDAWADVWRQVAERHPYLSLAARLFGVGVRYLQTKDERVLLDLVQEERLILRDLFGLEEGTDAS